MPVWKPGIRRVGKPALRGGHPDEKLMIAKAVCRILDLKLERE
jgi:hypothetical protein